MQKPQQVVARLEDKTVHNDKFTQYFFELAKPHTFAFDAGQYVSVKVQDTGARRSYSLCSSPDIKHGFELLLDISPGGIGSTFFEKLEFGAEIEVLGPLGRFTIDQEADENEIVLVATGSGIAPFRSIILDQLQVRGDKRPITLYWGMRHEEDMFWEMEFAELSDTHENFTFHPVLSKPGQEWTLSRGRVTDVLSAIDHKPSAGYYLCGSTQMIIDVEAILLGKKIDPKYIHFEKFY